MSDSPTTRPSLLARLRDARDREAWVRFVELYTPLVHAFARKHGLQDADAADLSQEVLRSVSRAAGRLEYDPARGSFRAWLFTVVRSKLHDFWARQGRPGRGSGDSGVQELLEGRSARDDELAAAWEREYEQRLFATAAEQVRPEFRPDTWQAFWRTAVEGGSASEVAGELGMTVGAVYVAKSRVLARLRERVRQLEAE
jgi:RNA polymerase sigma-70 factor (ECF subfamily)